MSDFDDIIYNMEIHSAEGLQVKFANGCNPNALHSGLPLFVHMVEMYTRGPRFKDCVRAFIDAGLKFKDQALLAVLAHYPDRLKEALIIDPLAISRTYSLFKNTYTPLTGGTLLHFCAEFNSVECAKVLIKQKADINARADVDMHGFGGHTPIFHTVNQNGNASADMLHLLLQHGADVRHTVKGIIWGKGYEWETFIPSVNPISYAMMGLLPQFQRHEKTIAETVSLLLKHAYNINYKPANVPNAYLKR